MQEKKEWGESFELKIVPIKHVHIVNQLHMTHIQDRTPMAKKHLLTVYMKIEKCGYLSP